MNADLIPNSIVEVGQTRFGNRLPLTLIAGRAKSEEDGQIIDNIVSQLLVPTAFSAVK